VFSESTGEGANTVSPPDVPDKVDKTWVVYQSISNELNSPKVLVCSSDSGKTVASSWIPKVANGYTDGGNLSYFVGLDADEIKPQTILSGDHNFRQGGTEPGADAVATWTTPTPATTGWVKDADWGTDMHKSAGNIGLGDGSAQQVSAPAFSKQIESAGSGGSAKIWLKHP